MHKIKLITFLLFISVVAFAQKTKSTSQTQPKRSTEMGIKKDLAIDASKSLIINEKGETEMKFIEAGTYIITLNQTAGRSAGGPIGGIIVKGGKNPGGQAFTAITNEKGEAELKISEAGTYNITLKQNAGKPIGGNIVNYNLTRIPTNEKGSGSPKQQGF